MAISDVLNDTREISVASPATRARWSVVEGWRWRLFETAPLVFACAIGALILNRATDVPPSYWSIVGSMVRNETNWLAPQLPWNGGLFDKPPLYLWLAALSVKAFGFHVWAVRLPDVCSGILCQWLAMQVAARTGRWAGVAAGWALAVTPGWLLCIATTPLTPELLLWLTLSLLFVLQWRERQSLWAAVAAATCWGLAFETKEWAALLPLPAFAVYAQVWRWDRYVWRQAAISAVVALTVAAAWPVWAAAGTGGEPYGGSALGALLSYNLLDRLDPRAIAAFVPGSGYGPPVITHPQLQRGPLWWLSDHAAVMWWPLLPCVALGRTAVHQRLAPSLWLASVVVAYSLVADPLPQYVGEALIPLGLLVGSIPSALRKGLPNVPRRSGSWWPVEAFPSAAWSLILWWGTPLIALASIPALAGVLAAIGGFGWRRALIVTCGVLAAVVDATIPVSNQGQIPWSRLDAIVLKAPGGVVLTTDEWTASGVEMTTGIKAIPLLDNYAGRPLPVDLLGALCPNPGVVLVTPALHHLDGAAIEVLRAHRLFAERLGPMEAWTEACQATPPYA